MSHLSHTEEMSSSHSHIFPPIAPADTFPETTRGVLCHYSLIFSPLSSFNDIKTLLFPLFPKLISHPAVSGLWTEPLLLQGDPRKNRSFKPQLSILPLKREIDLSLGCTNKEFVDLFWGKIHHRSQNFKKKTFATSLTEFAGFLQRDAMKVWSRDLF